MALYNRFLSNDTSFAFLDFTSPGVAVEHRSVASGTISIFQHSCSVGTIYYLQPDGGPILYTLNGASPSIVQGTGSNMGIPVSNGSREYFIPTTGLNVVKVLSPTGSVAVEVYLGVKSISGSVVVP